MGLPETLDLPPICPPSSVGNPEKPEPYVWKCISGKVAPCPEKYPPDIAGT